MKIGQALAVIGALASLGRGGLAAQARTGGKAFTLSGTVVDGVTNRPLAGVEVGLQTEEWKQAGDPAVSDAQGRFGFGGLAAGEYILSAEGSGFGRVLYGEAPDPGWVSTVRVGGESGDKSVVFRILPRGSIEGVVRDEFGDPMMRANVSLERPLWRDGRTSMANVAQKSTDDRGRYRFGNLAPGNYVVCTGGGQNAPAPAPGPVDYVARVDRFYTNTCNRAFQLVPGRQVQVDLSPLTAAAATVRGHVRNVPPQSGFSAYLVSEAGNMAQSFGAFIDAAQGTFAIRGVPPGRYRLRANANAAGKQLTAEIPVDVGGSDVDGLEAVLDSGGTVDVAVHGVLENHLDPVAMAVTMRSADSAQAFGGPAPDKDGATHFDGLPPGRYRLSMHTPAESCVESVKLGDSEVRGAFHLAVGGAVHLDVTVSRNCGSIEMRAVREGEAVPGAKVVLLLDGTAKDPGGLLEDFANDEGAYTFSGLAPGRYLVWAWAVTGKGGMAGPSSLAAVEQQAAAVEVKAGDPVHVDVPLLSEEGKGQ